MLDWPNALRNHLSTATEAENVVDQEFFGRRGAIGQARGVNEA
jgi:hypothetical protein